MKREKLISVIALAAIGASFVLGGGACGPPGTTRDLSTSTVSEQDSQTDNTTQSDPRPITDVQVNAETANPWDGLPPAVIAKVDPMIWWHIREKRWYLAGTVDENCVVSREVRAAALRGRQYLETEGVFIHLVETPTAQQVTDLEALGLILDLDSWIPPVYDHPYGFIIAVMPIDKVVELASRDYVMGLNSAEMLLDPQTCDPGVCTPAE